MTEYEKEAYHVEKKFPQTEWDKVPFQVTIDEPYVTEVWQHYTSQILVPYEVTTVKELIVYELEEYIVPVEVPFITENIKQVVDV